MHNKNDKIFDLNNNYYYFTSKSILLLETFGKIVGDITDVSLIICLIFGVIIRKFRIFPIFRTNFLLLPNDPFIHSDIRQTSVENPYSTRTV